MATCDRRSPEGVEGRAHAQPEVAQYPPSGAFSPEVDYRKWRHFPRAFFLLVVQNVGWDVVYDVRVYPFPWLSVPFIFIITYKVCCFRICCVVLQGWYFKDSNEWNVWYVQVFRFVFVCNVFWVEFQRYRGGRGGGGGREGGGVGEGGREGGGGGR